MHIPGLIPLLIVCALLALIVWVIFSAAKGKKRWPLWRPLLIALAISVPLQALSIALNWEEASQRVLSVTTSPGAIAYLLGRVAGLPLLVGFIILAQNLIVIGWGARHHIITFPWAQLGLWLVGGILMIGGITPDTWTGRPNPALIAAAAVCWAAAIALAFLRLARSKR